MTETVRPYLGHELAGERVSNEQATEATGARKMAITDTHRSTGGADGAPPVRPARGFDQLTADQARRALYIDFEGRIGVEPVLLGVLVPLRKGQTVLHQYVWDRALVMGGGGVKMTASLSDAVEDVVRRAESKSRHIVAWSPRELEVVDAYCDPTLASRLRDCYLNATLIAKPWRKMRYPNLVWERDARGRMNTLARYLGLIQYRVPDGCGEAIAARAIQRVQHGLERLPSFDALRPGVKAAWANLLCHNRHDCIGLREVCLLAAEELEAAGSWPHSQNHVRGSASAMA